MTIIFECRVECLRMLCRYVKYLTKKFLKKHSVRDWLRVIASNNDPKCASRWMNYLSTNAVHRVVYMLGAQQPQCFFQPAALVQRIRAQILQHRGGWRRGGGVD